MYQNSISSVISLLSGLQVKETAENVDEAVRELPDANLVRYTFLMLIFYN